MLVTVYVKHLEGCMRVDNGPVVTLSIVVVDVLIAVLSMACPLASAKRLVESA